MDFEFENGKNAVLKCGDKILGGVEKAQCTRKNTFTEIKEFLTDKPVERIISSAWELCFDLRLESDDVFLSGDSFDALELDLSQKRIIYSNCTVTEFTVTAKGEGYVSAEVKLSATERTVV